MRPKPTIMNPVVAGGLWNANHMTGQYGSVCCKTHGYLSNFQVRIKSNQNACHQVWMWETSVAVV